MGMTFDIMRRYSEAFFCYKAAVAAQPYNGQFWYWLGNHYWQRGMLDKAEQAYTCARSNVRTAWKEARKRSTNFAPCPAGDTPVPPTDDNPVDANPVRPINPRHRPNSALQPPQSGRPSPDRAVKENPRPMRILSEVRCRRLVSSRDLP